MTAKVNRSVFRAFALLKAFRSSDEWVTAAELGRRAGLAEASAYRFIQTLVEIGAVVRGPYARIRPGMVLVSLSQHVVVGEILKEAADPILNDLASRLDVTVNLACLQARMVTYFAKVGDTRLRYQLIQFPTGNSSHITRHSAKCCLHFCLLMKWTPFSRTVISFP